MLFHVHVRSGCVSINYCTVVFGTIPSVLKRWRVDRGMRNERFLSRFGAPCRGTNHRWHQRSISCINPFSRHSTFQYCTTGTGCISTIKSTAELDLKNGGSSVAEQRCGDCYCASDSHRCLGTFPDRCDGITLPCRCCIVRNQHFNVRIWLHFNRRNSQFHPGCSCLYRFLRSKSQTSRRCFPEERPRPSTSVIWHLSSHAATSIGSIQLCSRLQSPVENVSIYSLSRSPQNRDKHVFLWSDHCHSLRRTGVCQ